MEILESRYKNELAKAASVGRNELFRTVTSLVETAMEGSSEFDPAKREAMVQAMMKKYLTAYAPAFDVDPEAVSFGMPEAGVVAGLSGKDLKDLVQYQR